MPDVRYANDPDLPAEWRAPNASGLITVTPAGDVTCPCCESLVQVGPDETRDEIIRLTAAIRRIRRGSR